ncbi:MAG: hypothetical protein ACHBN1_34900 [Heteroscytonema crispum UTEX LB 1556]
MIVMNVGAKHCGDQFAFYSKNITTAMLRPLAKFQNGGYNRFTKFPEGFDPVSAEMRWIDVDLEN